MLANPHPLEPVPWLLAPFNIPRYTPSHTTPANAGRYPRTSGSTSQARINPPAPPTCQPFTPSAPMHALPTIPACLAYSGYFVRLRERLGSRPPSLT